MSLAESLRCAIRVRIPEAVLAICEARDRSVVENIVTVLAEHLRVNLALTSIEHDKNTYLITLPLAPDAQVCLADLRQVEAYSPARVLDLRVVMKSNQPSVVRCVIGDESAPVLVAETDVVRVTKRRRWWG